MEKKFAEPICPFCGQEVNTDSEKFDEVKECPCGAMYVKELAQDFSEDESALNFAGIKKVDHENIEVQYIKNFDSLDEDPGDEVYLVFGKIKEF
ncbi:MAG: hypothetical protein V1770_04390 [bacterium]